VSGLVLRWQEARCLGKSLTPEELCADCPELCVPLARELEALQSIEESLDSQKDPDATRVHSPPANGSPAPSPRSQLGRFRLEKLLGEGGFAQVYLAYDPTLDRQVAIKIPREHSLRSDFLRREALVAAKLKHPGIVQIYEIGPGTSPGPLPGDEAVYVV